MQGNLAGWMVQSFTTFGLLTILSVLTVAIFRIAIRIENGGPRLHWSLALLGAQLGLCWISIMASYSNPISELACLTGMFGFLFSIAVAVIDLVLLGWLLFPRLRDETDPARPTYLWVLTLRILTYPLFAVTILVSALRCTV